MAIESQTNTSLAPALAIIVEQSELNDHAIKVLQGYESLWDNTQKADLIAKWTANQIRYREILALMAGILDLPNAK